MQSTAYRYVRHTFVSDCLIDNFRHIQTINQAYAGSSTLTMNALLHRGYRASEIRRTFFRFDHVLQGKRPRGASETLSLRMLDASKRDQVRRKGAYSGTDLEVVARRIYNMPEMKLRIPGQRDGLLAMMGLTQPSRWCW